MLKDSFLVSLMKNKIKTKKSKSALHKVKSFFAFLKPKRIRKSLFVTRKIKPYIREVKPELKSNGFKGIKSYHKITWKYYGKDKVRFTFLAEQHGRKYVIKIAKGFDKKMNNSIYFQKKFNDIFDFIPKGGELLLEGYKCYYTELIDSEKFAFAFNSNKSSILDSFLNQANYILDRLNEFKIVHCDLEEVNILVEKKTHKIYLIDWDTICSNKLGLDCFEFPAYTIKRFVDGSYIFDDAYSFSTLFKRYVDHDSLMKNPLFQQIEEKIGRNEHIMKL